MRIAHAAIVFSLAIAPALAQNVKITPVGSHPGELCANDRAIVFEDPSGIRLLYDAGPTVTGGNDPRLGELHLVLLSHMHGDHVGNLKLKAPGAGNCANSGREPAPNSTTAEVVAHHNAVLVTTRAMAGFVSGKVQAIRGKPLPFCANPGGTTTVPVKEACSSRIDMGGVFWAQAEGAAKPVEITIVNRSGGSVSLGDIDLTGIAAVTVMLTAPAQYGARGGTLEIHADSASGTLLGASQPIAPQTAQNAPPIESRITLRPTSGMHDLYVVVRNAAATTDGMLMVLITAKFEGR